MRTRTLRLTAAVSTAALVLAAMLSCSTSNQDPGDPVGPPGPGAGGGPTLSLPDLQSVTPAESCATAGNLITLTGDNLVDASWLATVTIAGITSAVQSRTDGSPDVLVVATPALAVPATGLVATVQVTTPIGVDFIVGALKLWPQCQGPPIVTSISPATGSRDGFQPITLTGENLGCLTSVQFVNTSGTTVLNAQISQVLSNRSIVVLSPPTLDTSGLPFQIVVNTASCGTNDTPRPTFQYTGAGGGATVPDAIAAVDATTGLPQGPAAGGNAVRITGADLGLTTDIRIGTTITLSIGDAPATFIIDANNAITILSMPPSPRGPLANYPIAIVVEGAEGVDPTPVTYNYVGTGDPQCFALSDTSGPTAGGEQVTISGANLNSVRDVLFGSVSATNIFYPTVIGDQIVVITPPFPVEQAVDVQLKISADPSAAPIANCNPIRYTYIDPDQEPTFQLVSVVPDAGPQTGGTLLTLTGSGLDSVTSVTVCGVAATPTLLLSDRIEARTGAYDGTAPITCDIVVSRTFGGITTNATLPQAFTYQPVVPDAGPFDPSNANTAPLAGGTAFRLVGTNLIGVTQVGFGGSQAVDRALACAINVQSNTALSGIAPAYITPGGPVPTPPGYIEVRVVAESAAGADPSPETFRYYQNPTLEQADPTVTVDPGQPGASVRGRNLMPTVVPHVGEIEITNSGVSGQAAAGTETAILGPGAFTVTGAGGGVQSLVFTFPSSLTVEDFYDVIIRTPNGGADCVNQAEDRKDRAFLVGGGPNAASVAPSFGRWDGGTTVVIRGDFRLPVTRVEICNDAQVIVPGTQTDTEVRVTTRSTGSDFTEICDVEVFNATGQSTLTNAYTFVAEPDLGSVSITPLNPAACPGPLSSATSAPIPVSEGQTLTLNGVELGLSTTRGVNKVFIGISEASIIPGTRTDTRLQVVVPAPPAGGPRFTVTAEVQFPASPAGTTDTKFSVALPLVVDYLDAPVITSLSPASVPVGGVLIINGRNLRNVDAADPNPIVRFEGLVDVEATILSSSDTVVIVTVPDAGDPGDSVVIAVETCQGRASMAFTYPCDVPVINDFAPQNGDPGDSVTITGTGLLGPGGARPQVLFGATAAVVNLAASTETSLVVTVPPGSAGARATITVTTCGGSDTTVAEFEYDCPPAVLSAANPLIGVAGDTITLTGSFVNGGAEPLVLFGPANPSTDVLTFTNNVITAVVPPGTGTVRLQVQTCGGTSTEAVDFTYQSVATFSVTSIEPAAGPRSGNQTIRIGGTGLTGVNSITICGVAATNLTVISDTLLQAQTGAFNGAVPSACDVIVRAAGPPARSDTLTAGYTYLALVPQGETFNATGWGINSPQVGGTAFRIEGTSMRDTDKVYFGGVAGNEACNLGPPTDTAITGVAPTYPTPIANGVSVDVHVFPASPGGTDSSTVTAPGPSGFFRYWANPEISSVSPRFAVSGTPITVTGTTFVVEGEQFISGIVRIRNFGFTDPDNFPRGEFDVNVPIRNLVDGGGAFTPDSFIFDFPRVSAGDIYGITITTINQGLSCVADYEFTVYDIGVGAEDFTVPGACGDLLDNDGDAAFDCNDPDCDGDALCP